MLTIGQAATGLWVREGERTNDDDRAHRTFLASIGQYLTG